MDFKKDFNVTLVLETIKDFILQLALSVTSVALVGAVVGLFWYLLWKYILEPNPLVREFFDLDQKKVDTHDGVAKKSD